MTARLTLIDARRLTGPNLLAWAPLVVVELAFDSSVALADVERAYFSELARMRAALGFAPSCTGIIVRPHNGGAVIAYAEPIDVMLACTEMSEWAGFSSAATFAGEAPLPLEPKRVEIEAMLARDRSPRMLALEAEAKRRDLPFLWDDEAVSIGLGFRSATWPRTALPAIEEVQWETLGEIPIALVTGTNGKTTSTRLLARIVKEAGFSVGCSSSDGIAVDGVTIETGDWTGPAAARVVLRSRDVNFAVLETARGGILRRGLAIERCDAALITNVSEDHTGGYGIDDLAAMAQVKAIPARAVRASGAVVLNARDPMLVALAPSFAAKVVFFAHPEDARDGSLTIGDETVPVADIPITFGGAARYNIENALGAAATALALGIAPSAIAAGLRGFSTSDNPRRGELIERNGARILLDFAHNPDGIRAVMKLVASLRDPNGRLIVIAGSAGDRTDHELAGMCAELAGARPDRVLLRDLAGYLRGREPRELPAIMQRMLVEQGIAAASIAIAADEVDALRVALDDARAGDLIVLLVHLDGEAVHAFLDARS